MFAKCASIGKKANGATWIGLTRCLMNIWMKKKINNKESHACIPLKKANRLFFPRNHTKRVLYFKQYFDILRLHVVCCIWINSFNGICHVSSEKRNNNTVNNTECKFEFEFDENEKFIHIPNANHIFGPSTGCMTQSLTKIIHNMHTAHQHIFTHVQKCTHLFVYICIYLYIICVCNLYNMNGFSSSCSSWLTQWCALTEFDGVMMRCETTISELRAPKPFYTFLPIFNTLVKFDIFANVALEHSQSCSGPVPKQMHDCYYIYYTYACMKWYKNVEKATESSQYVYGGRTMWALLQFGGTALYIYIYIFNTRKTHDFNMWMFEMVAKRQAIQRITSKIKWRFNTATQWNFYSI